MSKRHSKGDQVHLRDWIDKIRLYLIVSLVKHANVTYVAIPVNEQNTNAKIGTNLSIDSLLSDVNTDNTNRLLRRGISNIDVKYWKY